MWPGPPSRSCSLPGEPATQVAVRVWAPKGWNLWRGVSQRVPTLLHSPLGRAMTENEVDGQALAAPTHFIAMEVLAAPQTKHWARVPHTARRGA